MSKNNLDNGEPHARISSRCKHQDISVFVSQINDACPSNNIFVSNSWSDPPAR